MNFQQPRGTRREGATKLGRFRGGKLAPVMAHPIEGSEGGTLSQRITMELDPIAGRLLTPITAELISVFVPTQAIDAIKDPEAAYAGMTEVIREKLLSGNPLFGLEDEGEISKRCEIIPKSIGGVLKVNEKFRLAHNAAVNYLRQKKYVKASTVLHSNTAITPALISQTVLERMNGVLDPDDRINGSFELNLSGMVPVRGLGVASAATIDSNITVKESGDTTGTTVFPKAFNMSRGTNPGYMETDANGYGLVAADLSEGLTDGVALRDLYNAEKRDALTRKMRKIVDENPEYGPEMVLRWAHGLSVDPGKIPFVLAHEVRQFGKNIVPAMDTNGVTNDVMRSDMAVEMDFLVPIPKTELGGVVITFACIKPDEAITAQPHPIGTEPHGLSNFVADELALDPVPVTFRELDANCGAGLEATVAMYTGLNALKQTYVHYGLSRQLDANTVENKTAVWQLEIPLSVTPDTILYPADLDHYPFADALAEVCTYYISTALTLQSPMIVGPTPVEELAVITDENLFEEV